MLAKLSFGQSWCWPKMVWPNFVKQLGQTSFGQSLVTPHTHAPRDTRTPPPPLPLPPPILQQSLGETQSQEVMTLPSRLMNFQWGREQKWNRPRAKVEPGSGMHSVFSHFPKDSNRDICLMTKITRASCRRRAGTVVPRAEHFLVT